MMNSVPQDQAVAKATSASGCERSVLPPVRGGLSKLDE